ncbi:MAG: nucleoside phosphorylase [Bacteroidetes bacterium]|nr:nucleoside phosphorylase [Bacteroidota bacterium]
MPQSELIINTDGSIYHLSVKPGELAPIIITVGDPDRVKMVSDHFDTVEIIRHHREFLTHTGSLKGVRISVLSTGIGPDNIDIAFNEADALFNLDFEKRIEKEVFTPLHFIRIGTSGTFRPEIPVNSFLVSEAALGLDNVMHYYDYELEGPWLEFYQKFMEAWKKTSIATTPYFSVCNSPLLDVVEEDIIKGITLTAPGFYAPQGRKLRAASHSEFLKEVMVPFEFQGRKFTNFEMETAAMYGLADVMGHQAISFNAILANRMTGEFSTNSADAVDALIVRVLDIITK